MKKQMCFWLLVLFFIAACDQKNNTNTKKITKKKVVKDSSKKEKFPVNSGNVKSPLAGIIQSTKQTPAAKKQGVSTYGSTVYYTAIGDTVFAKNADISVKTVYNLRYVKDTVAARLFKDYFEQNICPPGDTRNPIYKAFVKKARALETITKINFIKNCKWNLDDKKQIEAQLGDVNKIKDCKLILLPQYYMTYNVVMYKEGEKLSKYFNLDTMSVNYRVMNNNNKFIGIIGGNQDYSGLWGNFYDKDSSSYFAVVATHHQPVTITDYPYVSRKGGSIPRSSFGYVQGSDLIYALNQIEELQNTNQAQGKLSFKKITRIKSVDAVFAEPDARPLVLNQKIRSERRFMERRRTKQ